MLRLRSLTPVTYLCKLLGIHSLAAFLQLELFRVYNLVAHAEFLSVLAKAMSTPFNNENFIELPIREHLPLARYALVYPKNRRVGNETEAIINLVKNHPYHLYRGFNPIT
ncbi:hypothetical protein KVP97_12765 [Escherichia coli]|uniref:hypothetical protein n=1 Tax=Escherichia sp. MOD1-EC7003 TaxID=2093900 RepID=UPI0018E41B4E|nr:hypothetical protein [Escherichia sp. MOD1-EC7003]MCH0694665.1 hypothetical protein [Escherichia coli]